MEDVVLSFYEGNNIKRHKKVIRISIGNISDAQIWLYLKNYFKICFLLGSKERLIDIDKGKGIFLWVTYSQEEVSRYILTSLAHEDRDIKTIVETASTLINRGLIRYMTDEAAKYNIPYIKLENNLVQLGYGKNSIVIGDKCRENSKSVKSYDSIFIDSSNINYKAVCFKGKVVIVFRIDYESCSNRVLYNNIEISEEIRSFCLRIYKTFQIEFMYIDIKEEDELRVVDIGSVFSRCKISREIESKVGDCLLQHLSENGIGLIPIVSVTGTNGKTTVSRLIYYILSRIGINTGLTSTGGIFIGSKKIKNGDTTGFLSARDVLKNPNVEAAVLETARGGILKSGLGYEKARVAIITSLSEDHIGMQGIKSIKDLIEIKSLLLDEMDDGGKIIVKAEEELVNRAFKEIHCCFGGAYSRRKKMKENKKRDLCIFDIDRNEYIEEYIETGGEALFLEGSYIIYCKNGVERRILNVKEVSFTHNGISRGNILNLMAAIAAALAVVYDIEKIIKVLDGLKCDLYFNPGRQNILDIEDFKVILDYGHNAEAYEEVFSLAKSLNPSKITAIIAAAGDRMDGYIKELGSIAAKHSDYIIVREQEDLRGREKDESASLIRNGIIEKGFKENNFITIYKEQEALAYALEKAQAGEVIVLFTQCLDVVIPVINSYLEGMGKAKICEDVDFSH